MHIQSDEMMSGLLQGTLSGCRLTPDDAKVGFVVRFMIDIKESCLANTVMMHSSNDLAREQWHVQVLTVATCTNYILLQLPMPHHCKAHGVLEEHIVVLGDCKVMWVEEGLLHGEGVACHLLPVSVKLIDVNHHF